MFDSAGLYFLRVATEYEAVADWGHYASEVSLGSEPESSDPFIAIVIHQYLCDRVDSHLILIRFGRIHVVERIRELGDSVRSSEIDGNNHVELESPSKVIDEGRFLNHFDVIESQHSWLLYLRVREGHCGAWIELIYRYKRFAYELILTVFLPIPDLNSNSYYYYLKPCLVGLISLELCISKGLQIGFRLSLIISVLCT